MALHRFLATSPHWIAACTRKLYKGVGSISVPAPSPILRAVLGIFLMARTFYYFLLRVAVCEPLLKAYCTTYGKGVHTGVYIPWVHGRGELILGDAVRLHGKLSLTYAARFADRPCLLVGDHTGFGHDCKLVVGKRVSIGRHCLIAGGVWIFDSSGHSSDPARRLAGLPPEDHEVKPVSIGDNVWIGGHSIIFPGVSIGEGSVVAAGAIVMSDVAPYTIVAGNPARRIATLKPPAPAPASAPRSCAIESTDL